MESIHKQIQFCNRNKCEMCTFYSEVKPSSNVSSKASTYLKNQISHILCDDILCTRARPAHLKWFLFQQMHHTSFRVFTFVG